MSELTREIRWEPGYDYREEDKDKPWGSRRGVAGLRMRWLLTGPEGVVQFLMGTDWLPSWVEADEWGDKLVPNHSPTLTDHYPSAWDIGYHWPTPQYEDQSPSTCDLLPGGQCFYDGSGLMAEPILAALVRDGHEAVWALMEARYRELCAESVTT